MAAVAVRAPDCLLRPRLVLDRLGRIRRVGARSLAGAGTASRRAPHGAGPSRGADGSTSEWSDPVVGRRRDCSVPTTGGRVRRARVGRRPRVAGAVSVPPARRSRSRSRDACRLYASRARRVRARAQRRRVGDHVLAPGWTSYHHHLRYDAFDVTALLLEGANVIGGILGDGWFRGALVEDCAGTATAIARACSASSSSPTPTAPPRRLSPTTRGERRRDRYSPRASTKARPTTHAWS